MSLHIINVHVGYSLTCILGCGITALNGNRTFTGNATFLKNRHNDLVISEIGAGAISTIWSNLLPFIGTNNFFNNSASSSGIFVLKPTSGGAIYATESVVIFNGTNSLLSNSASTGATAYGNSDGGGLGGAIYAAVNTVLIFNGINSFTGNSALVYQHIFTVLFLVRVMVQVRRQLF